MKELDSVCPTIPSFDLVIYDNIHTCGLYDNFVFTVAQTFATLQELVCNQIKVHNCLGAELHGQEYVQLSTMVN